MKRRRRTVWLNVLFSLSAKNIIGKSIDMMLKKTWLKINQFPKIFNKYTIKITYDCTRNMKLTISIHKKQIVNPKKKQAEFDCKVKN